jgi:hypothetical protein
LKAVRHFLVSIAETRRSFNSGFDTVNLHRPTDVVVVVLQERGLTQVVVAQVEFESKF